MLYHRGPIRGGGTASQNGHRQQRNQQAAAQSEDVEHSKHQFTQTKKLAAV
jgi:hypothetical protein